MSVAAARLRDHVFWILRRSNAGFLSGFLAWFFIPALSRVLADQVSPAFHFALTGLLGGAFLGTVDGMVDESTPKTLRGALFGGAGGAAAGFAFGAAHGMLGPDTVLIGIFLLWGVVGACVGLVSALLEKKAVKILAGGFAGFVGGGIGGALGFWLYANIAQQGTGGGWLLMRSLEGLSGGIVGVTMWFFIGMAERFVVFKRRPVLGDEKHCDHCRVGNPLSSWYCLACGSVLQEAALPSKLHLSPYATLDRVRETFRFLSRLAATTGGIVGAVVFFIFLPANPALAGVVLVVVAALAYALLILFSSIAELLHILLRSRA